MLPIIITEKLAVFYILRLLYIQLFLSYFSSVYLAQLGFKLSYITIEERPFLKHTKKSIGWLSVQFSCSVMSDSLRPCESQHARPPCPSPSPGVHSDSMSIKSVMPSSHIQRKQNTNSGRYMHSNIHRSINYNRLRYGSHLIVHQQING